MRSFSGSDQSMKLSIVDVPNVRRAGYGEPTPREWPVAAGMSVSRSRERCYRLLLVDAATDTARVLAMGSGVTPGGLGLQERRTGDECEARELLALVATLRRTTLRTTYLTHLPHPPKVQN